MKILTTFLPSKVLLETPLDLSTLKNHFSKCGLTLKAVPVIEEFPLEMRVFYNINRKTAELRHEPLK